MFSQMLFYTIRMSTVLFEFNPDPYMDTIKCRVNMLRSNIL